MIGACVLTYRAIATGRAGMLRDTVASLAEAGWVQVFDNGSDDGTDRLVRSWGGVTHGKRIHTSGHGTNMQARLLKGSGCDILVLSDDDMLWRPGWAAKLEAWWAAAPDDIALTGCHIEPEFHWNTIRGTVNYGGIPGLLRDSTGAASWSLRAKDFDVVFGPAGIFQQVQGFGDVPACDRIHDRGYRVAQIDLADHVGEVSTWGNATQDRYGWDVAPVLEKLGAA